MLRMRKRFNKTATRHFVKVSCAIVVVALLLARCVYIDSFVITQTYDGEEVLYAYAGDKVTFTINGHIECASNVSSTRFVAAFLVPKSWNLAENAKVTYKCDLADDRNQLMSMSPIPESERPKNGGELTWTQCLSNSYGIGSNVLDDMEWVAFQTDQTWDILNGQKPTYVIYMTTSAGEKNLKFRPGCFVNHTDDGFSGGNDHKKVVLSNQCFEVVGGTGLTTDFCSNHFNKVTPMSSLQDDFLTFSFLGDAADNTLSSTGEVYIEGEAVTADGKTYTVTEKSSKTLMKRESERSNTYNITFWPVGFFNIPDGEEIVSINYTFTNADGTIVIGQSEDDYAQFGTALPAVREPFNFKFVCE